MENIITIQNIDEFSHDSINGNLENNKIIINSGLSDNINIQNAFSELTNNNNSVENSLYWINQYLQDCKDDKIIKIKKLLEISQANIDEAFMILDNIVSR